MNGTIDWVKLDIGDEVEEDAEMYLEAKMCRHQPRPGTPAAGRAPHTRPRARFD